MKNKLKVLIVEDELLIAEMLKAMVLKLGHEVICIIKEEETFFSTIDQNMGADLVLLDINLKGKKAGIKIGRELHAKYHMPFLYITSYSDSETIKEAAATNPEAYIIKPFNPPDIEATLTIVNVRLNLKRDEFIFLKDGHKNVKVNMDNIISIKADGNYIDINTRHKNITLRQSLENFLSEYANLNLVRIHRSFAVNLLHIEAIKGNYIIADQEKLPVSRTYRRNVIELFGRD